MGVQFETERNVEKEIYSAHPVYLGAWPRNLAGFGHIHGCYMPTTLTAFHMMMKCIHRSPEYDRHVYFGLVGQTF